MFRDGLLDHALESKIAAATKCLLNWEAEALLQAAEHDVVEMLLAEARVTCPTLLREEIFQAEPRRG